MRPIDYNSFAIKGNRFAFTGTMWTNRKNIIDSVNMVGGLCTTTVNPSVNVLVTGKWAEETKKYKKSIQLNIPRIDHLHFKKFLNRDLGSYGIVSTPKPLQVNPKNIQNIMLEMQMVNG